MATLLNQHASNRPKKNFEQHSSPVRKQDGLQTLAGIDLQKLEKPKPCQRNETMETYL
jgi:hypothetical protein